MPPRTTGNMVGIGGFLKRNARSIAHRRAPCPTGIVSEDPLPAQLEHTQPSLKCSRHVDCGRRLRANSGQSLSDSVPLDPQVYTTQFFHSFGCGEIVSICAELLGALHFVESQHGSGNLENVKVIQMSAGVDAGKNARQQLPGDNCGLVLAAGRAKGKQKLLRHHRRRDRAEVVL
jgi:hypothetical protein